MLRAWRADYISSTDEVWGTPVGEEGPPESGYVFLQVCCWTEDAATGISPDAEQAFDRRREKPQDFVLGRHGLVHEIWSRGEIRGLGEVVTCIYGPAVTYAFPDPLVAAYRHSVVHVSLISILDPELIVRWGENEKVPSKSFQNSGT